MVCLAKIFGNRYVEIDGMKRRTAAIFPPVRNLVVVTALLSLVTGSGCERPDTSTAETMDRQACLGSELTPIEALAACSRFIVGHNYRELKRSDAYYNRGVAFTELGEVKHARLDLEMALELDPRNQWARQRLEDLKQSGSNTAK
jgi:lipoprotein NlpI